MLENQELSRHRTSSDQFEEYARRRDTRGKYHDDPSVSASAHGDLQGAAYLQ